MPVRNPQHEGLRNCSETSGTLSGEFAVESAEVLDYLGWCLVEYGLPGGPEVLIRSLREQKAADEGEGVGMAKHAIDLLSQVTGRPTGLPSERPTDAEIAAVIPAWLAWWEEEKDHEGYGLPMPGK